MLNVPLCGEADGWDCPHGSQCRVIVNGLKMMVQMVETLAPEAFTHCLDVTHQRADGLKADDPKQQEIRYAAALLEGLLTFRQRVVEANEQIQVNGDHRKKQTGSGSRRYGGRSTTHGKGNRTQGH
jgi:hypothetical protein